MKYFINKAFKNIKQNVVNDDQVKCPKGELSSYWGQPPPTLTPKQVGSYWNFKNL